MSIPDPKDNSGLPSDLIDQLDAEMMAMVDQGLLEFGVDANGEFSFSLTAAGWEAARKYQEGGTP